MLYNEFCKKILIKKIFGDVIMRKHRVISDRNQLHIKKKVGYISENIENDSAAVDNSIKYEVQAIKNYDPESKKISIKHLFLKGILLLLIISGSVLNTAHAELNSEQVAASLVAETAALNIKIARSADDEEQRQQVRADASRIPDDKLDSTATQIDIKFAKGGLATKYSKFDQDDLKEEKDLKKSATHEPEPRELTDAQKLYALQSANMLDAYSLLQSEVIKNMRLYGNISEVRFEDGKRKYAEDKGNVFSQMLFMLYPSPAGELNTTFNGTRFSFSDKPITPELMAKFFAILNDYRNGIIIRDKRQKNDNNIYFNQNFKKSDKDIFLKFYGLDIVKLNEKIVELNAKIQDIDLNLSNSSEKEKLEMRKQKLQNDIDGLDKQINCLNSYDQNLFSFISVMLEIAHCDSENFENDTNKKIKAKENEIRQTINAVEKLESQKKEIQIKSEKIKKLKAQIEKLQNSVDELQQIKQLRCPKYLAEKILMSYLIKTLTTDEEVKKFYFELSERLTKNKSNNIKLTTLDDLQKFIEDEYDRLTKINKLVQAINVSLNSPYKNITFANGKSYPITFSQKGKEVIFKGGDFADCAETAVRHVINLLSYSKNEKWDILLHSVGEAKLNENDIKDLNRKLAAVINAISKGYLVEFYDLKTRLQMFFLYQSKHGADDQFKLTRTLWEYAICDMTEDGINQYNDTKADHEKMYAVKYKQEYYELYSGYINMLKLMYNIALALSDTTKDIKKWTSVQTSIKDLDKLIKNEKEFQREKVKNGKIEAAIKNVFSMFCFKDITIEGTETCECNDRDIFGKVTAKVCDKELDFIINHLPGHSYVRHNPFTFTFAKSKICDRFYDDFELLLLRKFDRNYNVLPNNVFYKIFSDIELTVQEKTDMYKKYKALSMFDKTEDEEINYYQIGNNFTNDVLDGAKLVSVQERSKGDTTQYDTLLKVLYMRFLVSYDGNYKYAYRIFNDCMEKVKENNFSYIKLNETEAKLFINNESINDEFLTIPSNISNLKVIRIAQLGQLFTCKKVAFGEGFEKLAIDPFTFNGFRQLNKVEFNTGLKELIIGSKAFNESGLEEFIVPASVETLTISVNTFANCKQLKTFTIEESSKLKKLIIGCSAFKGSSLTEFKVPKSVEILTIGGRAFNDCEQFKFFKIDGSKLIELTIGSAAFSISGITELEFSQSIKKLIIECSAFSNCKQLESFNLDKCSELTDLIIGEYAFAGSGLIEFKIPKNISKLIVDNFAFNDCWSLKNFNIDECVKLTKLIFGIHSFSVNDLSEFKIPQNVKTLIIDHCAFDSCDCLQTFNMDDCEQLTELVIKSGAFARNGLIGEFKIPSSVKTLTIMKRAFFNCKQLKRFNMDECSNLTELIIEDDALEESSFENLIIPQSVKILNIHQRTFSYFCGIIYVPKHLMNQCKGGDNVIYY